MTSFWKLKFSLDIIANFFQILRRDFLLHLKLKLRHHASHATRREEFQNREKKEEKEMTDLFYASQCEWLI